MAFSDKYVQVEDSIEAALAAGIIGAKLDMMRGDFIQSVEIDPAQHGDEIEFFVHMNGGVIIRCAVTEVKPV